MSGTQLHCDKIGMLEASPSCPCPLVLDWCARHLPVLWQPLYWTCGHPVSCRCPCSDLTLSCAGPDAAAGDLTVSPQSACCLPEGLPLLRGCCLCCHSSAGLELSLIHRRFLDSTSRMSGLLHPILRPGPKYTGRLPLDKECSRAAIDHVRLADQCPIAVRYQPKQPPTSARRRRENLLKQRMHTEAA